MDSWDIPLGVMAVLAVLGFVRVPDYRIHQDPWGRPSSKPRRRENTTKGEFGMSLIPDASCSPCGNCPSVGGRLRVFVRENYHTWLP